LKGLTSTLPMGGNNADLRRNLVGQKIFPEFEVLFQGSIESIPEFSRRCWRSRLRAAAHSDFGPGAPVDAEGGKAQSRRWWANASRKAFAAA